LRLILVSFTLVAIMIELLLLSTFGLVMNELLGLKTGESLAVVDIG